MPEKYDYYLFIWKNNNGTETYSPINFQKGIDPIPYGHEVCKNQSVNPSKNAKGHSEPIVSGFDIYELEIGRKIK